MKRKGFVCLLLVATMLTASLAGCSAKSEAVAGNGADKFYGGIYDSADGYYVSTEAPESAKTETSSITANQKLVRTMTMEAETDDMDALLSELDQKINSLGGYIEKKSTRNGGSTATRRYRYADLTVRIPADRLGEFVDHVSGETNVVYYNECADDITLRYVATQSRVIALETEQQRLLELLAKAENMTDLLLIEERLTNVRTELEQVTSQMRLYDNMVDYGTVQLSVTEVQQFTATQEKTVWQKIGSGLSENWKDLCAGVEAVFVFLITSLPYLIPIGAVGFVAVCVARRTLRKTRKRQAEPEQKEN